MTTHELLDILLAGRGAAVTGQAAAGGAAEESEECGMSAIASEARVAATECRRIHDLLGRIPIVLDFTEEG